MRKERFGGNWELVMNRDRWKCVRCEMTNEQHRKTFGVNLTIDHINGKGRNANFPDNRPENLQVLCLPCHGSKDAFKHGKYTTYKYAIRKIETKIMEDFNSN